MNFLLEAWAEIDYKKVTKRIRGVIHQSKGSDLLNSHGPPGSYETSRPEGMKYLIVIEETETGYSAYSPDVQGCVSTGSTREECAANIREAIEFHLEGMKEEGLAVPQPSSSNQRVRSLEFSRATGFLRDAPPFQRSFHIRAI